MTFVLKERSVGRLLNIGLLVAGMWSLFRYAHLTNEDAWISFKYARHLADGHGLVSNIGGQHEEGYSNLTLVVLLAALRRFFGADILWSAKLIGVASVIGTVVLARWLVLEFLILLEKGFPAASSEDEGARWKTQLRLLQPVLVVGVAAPILTSSHVSLWATAGLETSLYGLLVAACCTLTVWGVLRRRTGALHWVAIVGFVSWMTRPEGIINFFVASGVFVGWTTRRREFSRRTGAELLRASGWFAAMSAGILTFKALYFGDVLANPSYVKLAISEWGEPVAYLLQYVLSRGILFGAALLIASVSAAILLLRARSARSQDLSLFLVMLLCFLGSQVLFVWYTGGDYMPNGRFFVTHYPFLVMLILLAPVALMSSTPTRRARWLPIGAAGGAAAIVLQSAVVVDKRQAQDRTWYELGFIPPATLHERERSGYHLAVVELAAVMREQGGTYAAAEYGYVPYHVQAPGVDMMGLNQREVARNHKYYPLQEALAANRDFVLSRKPKVILTGQYWADESGAIQFTPAVDWFLRPYFNSEFFLRNYRTQIPREPRDWIFSYWNGDFEPARTIRWDEVRHRDKLLYGFSFEPGQVWTGPLARALVRPGADDRYIVVSGFVPDIQGYPKAELVIEIRGNDEAVGDRLLHAEVLTQSGAFRITAPYSNQMFPAGEDALITSTALATLDEKPYQPRSCCFLLQALGFSQQ